ncbi:MULTISPECIES: hypothetical protein [unclassified Mesorhizobium]|nr:MULTISPECIES: hypothetical protein [unclassified Mesorhizobium]
MALYILRHDELRSEWCLTMFASERAQAVTVGWTSPGQGAIAKGLLQ